LREARNTFVLAMAEHAAALMQTVRSSNAMRRRVDAVLR
jgi:hypothetical protein